MLGKRILGLAGIGVLISSLGVLAACSNNSDEPSTGINTAALSDANVSLELFDDHGAKVGTGTGVMIAPGTVLTSAHLVAGKARWTVTSADGKQKSNGIRGQTFDWRVYNSLMAHPRLHDVAVIFLDRPIHLAQYPKIAQSTVANGESVMRVRGTGKTFELLESKIDRVRQMPNAYFVNMPASETLDTGGAVVNAHGDIVGVVTGRGMQTGHLYIAKLNETIGWLSNKAVCGGASPGGALAIKTYGVPAPKPGCSQDGGTASGSSSGGSSSGASSTSSSSSSGSSGDNSSGGEGGGSCNEGGGYEFPGGGGGPGSSVNSGVNTGDSNNSVGGSSGTSGAGGSSGTSGGSSGTSGGAGGTTSGGTNTGDSNNSVGGSSGTGGGGGTTSGSSGTSGGAGGADNGSNNSGSNSTLPSGSGAGGGAGGVSDSDQEVCESSNDNPDVCPPEAVGCEGSACGGGDSPGDNTVDYGNCSCAGVSGSSGPIILR